MTWTERLGNSLADLAEMIVAHPWLTILALIIIIAAFRDTME